MGRSRTMAAQNEALYRVLIVTPRALAVVLKYAFTLNSQERIRRRKGFPAAHAGMI